MIYDLWDPENKKRENTLRSFRNQRKKHLSTLLHPGKILSLPSSDLYSGPYKLITIPSGKLSEDVVNFPVYLRLADLGSAFFSTVDSAGAKIRITNAEGSTAIPADVVNIDTLGNTGHLFFKANLSATSDNIFRLYFDTGLSAPSVTDPIGRNAVWSAFDWITLLENTSYVDRTGGAAGSLTTGSVSSSPIALGAGGGLDFVSGRLLWASRPGRSIFTVAATIQPDVSSVTANMCALSYFSTGLTTHASLLVRNASPDHYNCWQSNGGWMTDSAEPPVAGVSRRMHLVYNSSVNRTRYIDGTSPTTGTSIESTSFTEYCLGGNAAGSELINGKIGYAYSRPEALSAAYIAGEYLNLNNPTGFYTVS